MMAFSVCAVFLRESQSVLVSGLPRVERRGSDGGLSEDKLAEKKPWQEWCRWLRSRSSRTIIPSHVEIPLPEVWLRVVDTVCAPRAGAVCSVQAPRARRGSDCQRNSSRSTGADKDGRAARRSSALSCSHTLHRGKAASSRTGSIMHSVSEVPRRRSQSDLHRRFPCRRGRMYGLCGKIISCNKNLGRNGLPSSLESSSRAMSAPLRVESLFAVVLRSEAGVQAAECLCRPAPLSLPWHDGVLESQHSRLSSLRETAAGN